MLSASTTAPFIAAMDAEQEKIDKSKVMKTRGENGAPEYNLQGVGDPRVALFFKLVRGLEATALTEHLANVQRMYDETGDVGILVDLIVLAFQTRATRGEGKGEKALFIELFVRLHARFPSTAERLLALVPHFGYFKDWLLIADAAEATSTEDERARLAPVVRTALDLFAAKLNEDAAELKRATADGDVSRAKLSLAAKWAPREGRKYSAHARTLAERMFPEARPDAARRLYRRRVAELNRALATPEVLMSAHRFAEIEFAHVASLAMARHRKAFLNEKVKGPAPQGEEEETGNRLPEDVDRVAARRKLRALLASKARDKIKGAALQPHELVHKALAFTGRRQVLSTAEADVINAQWDALRDSVREQLAQAAQQRDLEVVGDTSAAPGARAVDLGKLVPLVDVSGSMTGTPMEVAIAMGILVSELTAPAFAHRFLTFESTPQWVSLERSRGLVEKARNTQRAPWGGSTNFEAALEAILRVAEERKLKPDEIPDLIVFSDMQFNQAHRGGAWETHFERLQRRFAEVGTAVSGEPYPAPRVIFWNLRANTVGFPAQSDTPNTQMISGFSPALLKLVLSGADLVADEEEVTLADGTKRVVKSGPTPYETLRKALDSEAFDVVRATIAEVGEGVFAGYSFETADGFTAVGTA